MEGIVGSRTVHKQIPRDFTLRHPSHSRYDGGLLGSVGQGKDNQVRCPEVLETDVHEQRTHHQSERPPRISTKVNANDSMRKASSRNLGSFEGAVLNDCSVIHLDIDGLDFFFCL